MAFASALVCIRWLLRFISTRDFTVFAAYRIVLGLRIEGPAVEALGTHRGWIAAETLAVDVLDGAAPGATF